MYNYNRPEKPNRIGQRKWYGYAKQRAAENRFARRNLNVNNNDNIDNNLMRTLATENVLTTGETPGSDLSDGLEPKTRNILLHDALSAVDRADAIASYRNV